MVDPENCDHPEDAREIEDIEVDTMRNGEHDTYPAKIYVCGKCGMELEGDPAIDIAEARADYEADNWDPDR